MYNMQQNIGKLDNNTRIRDIYLSSENELSDYDRAMILLTLKKTFLTREHNLY